MSFPLTRILAERHPLGQDARMKGDLFSSDHMVQPAVAPGMTIQNAKSIKYAVNGDMLARQGAMIAYRGNLQFERKGQGVGGMLKRAVTGEGLPLMTVRGQGEAWFAHEAQNCFIVDIEPGDELGYEYQLTWDSTDDPDELALYRCLCGAKACRGTMLDPEPLDKDKNKAKKSKSKR